jgi:O-antigen/teichoic acid export membrane protein
MRRRLAALRSDPEFQKKQAELPNILNETPEKAPGLSVEIEAPPRSAFGRRLIGGTFNYGLGSILPQVVGFLLIPVYTVFLTPADYGILDLTTYFGAILVVLMRFGVPGAVTRFYFDHREGESLRDYVTTINRFLWASSLLVGALALCMMVAAGRFIMPGVSLAFTALVIIISLLSSNTDLQRRLIQAREQSRYSALLSSSFALGNIALAILFIAVFHWGVRGMLLAQLIAGFIFFLQARYYLAPDLAGSFHREYVGPSLRYGLGILPSHLLANFAPFFVRSVLASQDSLDAVGVFGLASRFTSPLLILFAAFSTAFLPIYYAFRKDGSLEKELGLAHVVRNTWTLALFLFLTAELLAPPAIEIMTPTRFHSAVPLVRILAFGFLGQAIYLLLTPEIFYQKKTWMISLVSLTGVVVNVLTALVLLKRYGPAGIAWAAVFGQVSSGILAGLFSLRIGAPPQHWQSLAKITVVGSIVCLTLLMPRPANAYLEAALGVGILIGFVMTMWMMSDPALKDLTRVFKQFRAGANDR